ncbi:MAG: extracellular solute-binding protein [Chloroflexi bacterium]|nr:extracellular solute-binding protein [Chloroflexota bacterium]
MKRNRKMVLVLMLAGVFGMLVAACGADDPTATPTVPVPAAETPTPELTGFEAEWAALLVAAREEGEIVTFLCCDLGRKVDAIIPEFEAEFGIKWINSTGSSRQQWDRVQAERAAGKFELDIWTGGLNTSINRLLPGGALRPIKPLLIHPEVLDESLWFEGHFWADFDLAPGATETQLRVFAYGGSAEGAPITYNTDLLDPNEIQSFQDLLDPKWDGLRIARDPREAGTSQSTALYYLLLGPDFLRAIIEGSVITSDARQAADQLANGQYAMCLFACGTEVGNAKEQGLPVEDVFPHLLEEGGRISTGGNTLMALDSPPNPNAQKLWVNWWLSKVGQTHYQNLTNEQSLRTDIGTENVDVGNIRQPGVTYLMFERDPAFNDKLNEAVDFAKEILAGT